MKVRAVALGLVLAVLVAACGRSGDGQAGGSSTTVPASATSSVTSGDFGTLKGVCSPGDASGATDQGVTDDAIRIATFSDVGFAGRPGLNQELFDSAEVFAAWCNDAGGINGREIVVDERDAALTNYRSRIVQSCQQDFFMVGGGAVFDDSGVKDRLECLLPDIAGYVVTPPARGADLLVQPVPNPNDTIAVGLYRWLGEKYPASTKRVGVLTGDLPTTVTVADQSREAVEAMGWKVVYNDRYPPAGVQDWTPYSQALKDDNVDGLIWVGEPEGLAGLLRTFPNIQYELDWVAAPPNHYDEKLVSLAGPAARRVYMGSGYFPFERAKRNAATREYLELFAKYKPNAKTKAMLGLQAWSAWLLFAEAARTCGSNLTRRCVYDNARKVTDWTGGGLQAPTDPGAATAQQCYLVLQATPDGFVTPDVDPNTGPYNCSPKNVATLQGDYGSGVTLADVGKSLDDLK